mgnify:CR=1 FL=1
MALISTVPVAGSLDAANVAVLFQDTDVMFGVGEKMSVTVALPVVAVNTS